uniref:Uncharacterized protein n=1 Tax=Sus scrofa TaxID=9823 RepID=A0A8D1NYW5_PIG
MGTLGQCVRKARVVSPLARVQSRQNLMVPEPRSLSLFTKKPPRNVPPPPAGTTRYPPPTKPFPPGARDDKGPGSGWWLRGLRGVVSTLRSALPNCPREGPCCLPWGPALASVSRAAV